MPCPAGFAVVKLATEKATGEEYAVKIMALPEKGRVVGENENTRDDIFKEIDILVGLNHPNVIYLKEYFEESNKVRQHAPFLTSEAICPSHIAPRLLSLPRQQDVKAVCIDRGMLKPHWQFRQHTWLQPSKILPRMPPDRRSDG